MSGTPRKSHPRDLDNPREIERLVRAFYSQVATDEVLGPVFVEQAGVDWNLHIPKLVAFWCQIELGIHGFRGNPTGKHVALSAEKPFTQEMFDHWVTLFQRTVDSRWSGPRAESIKQRAATIAVAQARVVLSS